MNSRTIGLLAVFGVAAASCQAFAAGTIELPSRKPGHWEIKMVTEVPSGGPETLIQLCIDAETDKLMMEQGMSLTDDMCSKREMKREGDTIVIDAVCTMGPVKSTSHTVISGDFQSSYTMKISGDVDGLPAGRAGNAGLQQTSMTQHARWLSADCPDGLTAGDMKMPGGMKVNVKDMLDRIPPAKD